MNAIKYQNFTEFYKSFQPEFSRTNNQRLKKLFITIANLGKGCGCTRRKRAQYCSKEYRSIKAILNQQDVQIMKMKYPMTKFEFLEAKDMFYVINP